MTKLVACSLCALAAIAGPALGVERGVWMYSIPSEYHGAANIIGNPAREDEAIDFYDEHVVADSVHENVAAYDLAQNLAEQKPRLAGDIVWGARALLELEGRFANAMLTAWDAGVSSLRDDIGLSVSA